MRLAGGIGERAVVLDVVPVVVVLRAERGGESAGELEFDFGRDVDRLGAALVASGVVRPHHGHQRASVVAVDLDPG